MKQVVINIIIITLAALSGISCTNFVERDTPTDIGYDYSPSGTIAGHDYVDLGLDVMWATCNVGASKPEEYGGYYAWGETAPKQEYAWENYRFWTGGDTYDNVTFWKYNTMSERGIVDNKTKLELSDDIASVTWGGPWRLPTEEDLVELQANCTWVWMTKGGHNGYMVISLINGKSIFLPAAGLYNGNTLKYDGASGRYWASSILEDRPYDAYVIDFKESYVQKYTSGRYGGRSVRPVFKDAGTR